MKVKVYNTSAVEVGSVELNDAVFGCDYNEALIHQAVVAYQANQRQGTKSALTRTEVRGGGIKPWRQKGTGRARQGSIRAPQWIKGGVVFAPKPRDFSQKVNKQMKKGAFVSALSKMMAEKAVIVLDELNLDAIKTQTMVEILNALKVDKRFTIVTTEADEKVVLSCRNIPNANVATAATLNTYDLVVSDKVIFTQDAIKKIEEACK